MLRKTCQFRVRTPDFGSRLPFFLCLLLHRRVAHSGQFHGVGAATLSTTRLLVALGSRNENSNPISTLRTKIPTGPGVTCLFLGSVLELLRTCDSSKPEGCPRRGFFPCASRRASYSHTRLPCSEMLAFWPPPGHARGRWWAGHDRFA